VLLEELTKRNLYFIVTTHHKKLASLMASNEDVELMAALYDEEARRPTYRYLRGTIGKSYAFETASRYGISDILVDRAKEALGEDQERISELIERSTQLEIEMREKLEEAKAKVDAISLQEQKLQEQKERLVNEHKRKLFELEQNYNGALKKLQIALKKAENPDARRLINEANELKRRQQERKKDEHVELKVGDSIKYRGKRGVVISLKSKEAMVELDGIRVRVPRRELRVVEPLKSSKKAKANISVSVTKPQNSKMTIKLLGVREDDARERVENFLSDALIHGFNEVEIIHGSGAGILSKMVDSLLKRHPKVKSFSRVPGNLGATIVEL